MLEISRWRNRVKAHWHDRGVIPEITIGSENASAPAVDAAGKKPPAGVAFAIEP
jgi:hypothetical protein